MNADTRIVPHTQTLPPQQRCVLAVDSVKVRTMLSLALLSLSALMGCGEAARFASGMVRTSLGGVHYVTNGGSNTELSPLFLFHMSPRSTDEFLEAMPLLSADDRLVVAIDEPGYGRSESPCRSCSLDDIADCALDVAAELGVDTFAAVGSLLGCFLSLSLAQRHPERPQRVAFERVRVRDSDVEVVEGQQGVLLTGSEGPGRSATMTQRRSESGCGSAREIT